MEVLRSKPTFWDMMGKLGPMPQLAKTSFKHGLKLKVPRKRKTICCINRELFFLTQGQELDICRFSPFTEAAVASLPLNEPLPEASPFQFIVKMKWSCFQFLALPLTNCLVGAVLKPCLHPALPLLGGVLWLNLRLSTLLNTNHNHQYKPNETKCLV